MTNAIHFCKYRRGFSTPIYFYIRYTYIPCVIDIYKVERPYGVSKSVDLSRDAFQRNTDIDSVVRKPLLCDVRKRMLRILASVRCKERGPKCALLLR